MKLLSWVSFCLCVAAVLAGIIPPNVTVESILGRTPNPNDVLAKVKFSPLNCAEKPVEVELKDIGVGIHAIAFERYKQLYPQFVAFPLSRCVYTALGTIRFYVFTVAVAGTLREAKTAVEVPPDNAGNAISNSTSEGFSQVSVYRALDEPSISQAVKIVIKANWKVIQAYPLVGCWEKLEGGIWIYRFKFQSVPRIFQYKQGEVQENPAFETHRDSDFADDQPLYASGAQPTYNAKTIEEFSRHPAAPIITGELHKTLGFFKPEWIMNVSISSSKGTDFFQISINFQPFLVRQEYEAHYFGTTKKAALLKIDEKTFSNNRSYDDWQEIKSFNSFFAFHEANQYVLTQFTWLRFYNVTAAYSSLHLTGRYVRLVYQGMSEFVDAKNQVNVVVYIDDCGRYYIDRNDFSATNLNSVGRTNWISFFISTPDMTKAEYYQSIVKFFKSIYPQTWSSNQLVDIKFKDNLHVVEFKNPTNINCVGVFDITNDHLVVLNKFNWTKINYNSPLAGRLESFGRAKRNISRVLFIQSLTKNDGIHYQINYLDESNMFSAFYVKYIPATDVFYEDEAYKLESLSSETSEPLPKDIQSSIVAFLKSQDSSLNAVFNIVAVSSNSFAVIVLSGKNRWQVTLAWTDNKWTLSSKQPYSDGYFKAVGVLSSGAAACNGYLKKLYPGKFKQAYLIAEHAVKNVGVNIFNRIIFDFGTDSFEAVVKVTFGVDNSHVLDYWKPLLFLKRQKDYGYGTSYDFDYGEDKSLFYESEAKPVVGNLSTDPSNAVYVAPYFAKSNLKCPSNTKLDIFGNQCIVVFGL